MMYPARGGLVWGQMRGCYQKSGGLTYWPLAIRMWGWRRGGLDFCFKKFTWDVTPCVDTWHDFVQSRSRMVVSGVCYNAMSPGEHFVNMTSLCDDEAFVQRRRVKRWGIKRRRREANQGKSNP